MILILIIYCIIGFALSCVYALFCNWLFRLILRPLSVPESFVKEGKRDRIMTFIIFLSVPGSWIWISVLLLLGTYAVGTYQHFKERGKIEPVTGTFRGVPRIPRIALSELMVMIFSIAFFPLVISGLIGAVAGSSWNISGDMLNIKSTVTGSAFVVGALIFPICFASAYQRLDSNRVAMGYTRMVFLFLYPYMVFAMHLLVAGGFHKYDMLLVGGMTQDDLRFHTVCQIVLSAAVLTAGALLARRAKEETTAAI